jgi:serine/threonine-protein kinase
MSAGVDRAHAYRVFCEALELAGGARATFLDSACAGQDELRQVVCRLLAIADQGDEATGLLIAGGTPDLPDRVGRQYGVFRLLESLGAGGMGAVYRAERTDGVPQLVAIKMLREGVTAAESGLFLREARILAQLDHPSIARLIDVGVNGSEGWIAMELVRGERITDYCDSRGLDLPARVRLLVAVADAVATAHRALVVHRDLKPSNVLVTDDGLPKLIDFGIASALPHGEKAREATSDILRLFTPHFAAPEQVKGEPVTVATDVFGLGALAYRVLTGREPYADADSPIAYLLSVTRNEVEPPSAAARAAGGDASRVRQLRGDLDSVLIKALAREPARRYHEVKDLRDDLQAYLDGRPVQARAPSMAYRAGKFARRHPVGLGIAAALSAGLMIAGGLYVAQERRVAVAQAAAARRGAFLEKILRSADPRQGSRDITVAELLDAAAANLPQSLGSEPLVEASMLGLIVDTNSSLGRYQQGIEASDRQLELLRSSGGSTLEIAKALTTRGELLRTHGKYPEAIATLRESLGLLEQLRNVDAEREATLHELGGALANTNAEKEAESMLRQAIALAPRLPPDERGEVTTAQNDLAILLAGQGRYAESAEMARAALDTARHTQSADHPYVLIAEQTYAMALLNLHRPAEVEPLQRDIIERSARVNGPNARDTLIAKVQLGETLIDLGRYAEAAALLRPAAESLEQGEGADNRFALGAWSDFALASCSGTGAAEGLAAAQRVLETRTRLLAADDWHLLRTRADVGLCLTRLHRYDEAEPLLLKTAADLEATRGPEFYSTQLAYKALRELYRQKDNPAAEARFASKIKN